MAGVRTLLRTATGLVFPRTCAGCARPDLPILCGECAGGAASAPPRELDGFESVGSAFTHEGAPRAALLAVKLGGERRGSADLAAWLPLPASGYDVVTSVPDSYQRRVQRGGSVTGSMARAFARRQASSFQILLARHNDGRDLGGASRRERAKVLEGVFHARRPVVGGVLLIDDVVTTGSTAIACSRALRSAGARSVAFLSFTSALLD